MSGSSQFWLSRQHDNSEAFFCFIQLVNFATFGPENNVETSWNKSQRNQLESTYIYSRMMHMEAYVSEGIDPNLPHFFPYPPDTLPYSPGGKFLSEPYPPGTTISTRSKKKPKIHSHIHQIELPSTIFTWNLKICFFLVPKAKHRQKPSTFRSFSPLEVEENILEEHFPEAPPKTKGWMPKMMGLGKGGSNLNMAIFGINSPSISGGYEGRRCQEVLGGS